MKRSVGGGRHKLYQVLHDRIEIADKEFWTVDKMVDHLRSSYRDYSRVKVDLLRKNVKRVMMEIDGNTQIVNKRRKMEDTVEKSCSSELDVVDVKEVDLINDEGLQVMGVDSMNEKPELGGRNKSSLGDENETRTMFKDLGGINEIIEELKMEVILPLLHPLLLPHVGGKPMAGLLLHGPPGCGKTKLANAIANEAGRPFYKISATELVSGVSGASEENIRELFANAHRTAPSVVFIDEIDSIASKRDNLNREMEKRIVTQLMTCMDDGKGGYVLVIGATNRPDALDPSLRRAGRFDREIMLNVPDEVARVEILSVLTSHLRVEGSLDLRKIAKSTPGFVGADLMALANKTCHLAIKRVVGERRYALSKEQTDGDHNEDYLRLPFSNEEMNNIYVTMTDFEEAAKMVQPSLRREGFSAIPNVKWDDVGGLHLVRQEFSRYIVNRIKFPENYKYFKMYAGTGFLLYGPPGCGKTLIAKAVANEAGANFIHIKGPELLNKYVGESELTVRTIFSRARTCSPCILFFDELDALTAGNELGSVVERVLKQLLIELDGAEQRKGVYVIGATNRPEVMDRALLRPGRFGNLLYVPLPSPDERGMILKALAREMPIDLNVDLVALGKASSCDNLSGADLCAVIDEASMIALEDDLSSTCRSSSGPPTMKYEHLTKALDKISPSVSDEQIHHYKLLSETLRGGRAYF